MIDKMPLQHVHDPYHQLCQQYRYGKSHPVTEVISLFEDLDTDSREGLAVLSELPDIDELQQVEKWDGYT